MGNTRMHAFQTYERIQTDLTVKVVFRRNAFSSHADFTSLPHRPFAYHVFSNICTEVTEQMKTNKLWHEVIRTAGKSTRNHSWKLEEGNTCMLLHKSLQECFLNTGIFKITDHALVEIIVDTWVLLQMSKNTGMTENIT